MFDIQKARFYTDDLIPTEGITDILMWPCQIIDTEGDGTPFYEAECEPEDADIWAVFIRNNAGEAVNIADFETEQDAINFVSLMQQILLQVKVGEVFDKLKDRE